MNGYIRKNIAEKPMRKNRKNMVFENIKENFYIQKPHAPLCKRGCVVSF